MLATALASKPPNNPKENNPISPSKHHACFLRTVLETSLVAATLKHEALVPNRTLRHQELRFALRKGVWSQPGHGLNQ